MIQPISPIEENINLENSEANIWSQLLGAQIETSTLPKYLSSEVIDNLEKLGYAIRYIPNLDLGTLGELQTIGSTTFIENLQTRYPNWRRYESLTDQEKANPSIIRNLEELYWNLAKVRQITFPNLIGTWIAIETAPKPSFKNDYQKPSLGKFNTSWIDAYNLIKNSKNEILQKAGLPDSLSMRMLDALEWNLLANREGWGSTESYEWTNTDASTASHANRLIIGDAYYGGAAHVHYAHPSFNYPDIGFRSAIILS